MTQSLIQSTPNEGLTNLKNVLELNIFDDKSTSDLIRESLETTQEIEQEARELYNEVKTTFLKPSQGRKLSLEDAVMLGPVAQDYLKLMSDQVDNRTKLIKAISDLVKAAAPNTQLNQMFNGNSEEINLPSQEIQDQLRTIDPTKSRELTTNEKREKEKDEINLQSDDGKDLRVLHSYKHK